MILETYKVYKEKHNEKYHAIIMTNKGKIYHELFKDLNQAQQFINRFINGDKRIKFTEV